MIRDVAPNHSFVCNHGIAAFSTKTPSVSSWTIYHSLKVPWVTAHGGPSLRSGRVDKGSERRGRILARQACDTAQKDHRTFSNCMHQISKYTQTRNTPWFDRYYENPGPHSSPWIAKHSSTKVLSPKPQWLRLKGNARDGNSCEVLRGKKTKLNGASYDCRVLYDGCRC